MKLPEDFKEFIELLNTHEVQYVMVGGWVYNLYAPPRATGDIDFFVDRSPANEKKLRTVLTAFGFGSALPESTQTWLTVEKVIMLGREPFRIDLLCHIDGISFDEAFSNRMEIDYLGLKIPVLSIASLIQNKEATGREKDKADVAMLKRVLKERQ